ncbi:hypothetical protein LNP74_25100 [Klebsiella pneumoniae subsp. pneumoniae]|nr:hypothetical protein [Klebsiella pneumoniae subsp. pneumoniae]
MPRAKGTRRRWGESAERHHAAGHSATQLPNAAFLAMRWRTLRWTDRQRECYSGGAVCR